MKIPVVRGIVQTDRRETRETPGRRQVLPKRPRHTLIGRYDELLQRLAAIFRLFPGQEFSSLS